MATALTPPMKLTYDTLLHVISLTAYAKDSAQIIATCRVLYHEGSKIALKKPITIFTEEQLASFLQFVRADKLSRCRYLRQLYLWSLYPEPECAQELIETLPHLINIEYLRLAGAEDLLESFPALVPAFAGVTSLRHLDLCGAKELTCNLLSSLRAPLVSARIDFLPDDDVKLWDRLPIDEWSQYHPTILLSNFAETLEELQCVAWYTIEDTVIPATVFPNMRKLAIELHEFPLRIDPFIRAFPNLTHLSLTTEYHGGHYSDDMRDSHDINVAQQLDPVNSCGTWAHLKHVSACLFDIYAIGLTCHVPRLTIGNMANEGMTTEMLATVLHYARPVHLKLTAIPGSILGNAEQGLISMLRDESASDLTNLDVCIYFGAEDREKDLALVLSDLFSAMGRLPLKSLELTIHTHDLDPTPGKAAGSIRRALGQTALPDPVPAPLTPAELSLDALDKDDLLGRLAGSLTALEDAHILITSSRRGGEEFEKTITKGTSCLVGREQWQNWVPGKNRMVF